MQAKFAENRRALKKDLVLADQELQAARDKIHNLRLKLRRLDDFGLEYELATQEELLQEDTVAPIPAQDPEHEDQSLRARTGRRSQHETERAEQRTRNDDKYPRGTALNAVKAEVEALKQGTTFDYKEIKNGVHNRHRYKDAPIDLESSTVRGILCKLAKENNAPIVRKEGTGPRRTFQFVRVGPQGSIIDFTNPSFRVGSRVVLREPVKVVIPGGGQVNFNPGDIGEVIVIADTAQMIEVRVPGREADAKVHITKINHIET